MRKPMRSMLGAGLLTLCLGAGAWAAAPKITETTNSVTLSNGMELLMVQQPGQPNIFAGWVAHVGSANERPGITGMAHLFEHMMFKGSPTIGTNDFAADERIRGELDAIRDEMFALERKMREQVRLGMGESLADPALQTDEMQALQAQFDALIEQQREVLVNNEFDQVYTENGASRMNAFTNQDMTVYFIAVPQNKLELWFWMESERLLQPIFREFYSERDVVYEERRLRTESTPTGAQDEVFNALFWRGHPYAWPVVGWPSDISAITREQAENFYDEYYAPQNITLAIVGDFDEDQAVAWAEEYFGRIEPFEGEVSDVVTMEMPLLGDLEFKAEVDAPPSVLIEYPTVAYAGVDDPALQVLAATLSGKTGRLYKRMVLEDQVATAAGASASGMKYAGTFSLSAQGKQGVDPERLRDILLEEVQKVIDEGISDYELEKVKNQLAASQYRRLEDPFFLMIQLLYYDGLRDWRVMDSIFARLNDVTVDGVQRVAKKYLEDQHSATKLYYRKESATPEDPELAKFSPAEQTQIKQMMAQINSLPKERLQAVYQQLSGAQAQAPEQAQAALSYVLSKLQEKIDAE